MPAGQGLRRWCRTVFEAACGQIPSACPLCASPARGGCLCKDCQHEIRTVRQSGKRCGCCGLSGFSTDECPDCLALSPAYERVVCAFDYARPADVLIQQYKQYRFQYSRLLTELLIDALAQAPLPPWWPQAVLVPIPATKPALRRRGFNPAAELAQRLSKRLNLPVRSDWLLRSPSAQLNPPQKQLSREQRLTMQQHAYVCPQALRGAHVVLVDDVMTTGATLHSAAQGLRRAGAGHVWGLVAARTPYAAR